MSTTVYDANGDVVATLGGNPPQQVTDSLGAVINPAKEDGHLASIDTKVPASPAQDHTTAASPASSRLSDGSAFYKATTPADTQPISAATLPLPSGASTAVNQTTANSSLSSIDGKLNSLGQKTSAASVPVVVSSEQILKMTPSTVSTGNSTTTPLGGGATFTGAWEEVKDYAVITVTVFSNVASAINGLQFQWSSDGVNTDRTESSSLLASTGRAFSLTTRARYYRAVLINGASAQAAFRLQSVYHQTGYGHISKPLGQTATDDNFAELVQAPTMGRMLDGTYRNIGAVYSPGGEVAVQTVSHNRLSYEVANSRVFGVALDFNLPVNGVEAAAVLIRNPVGSGIMLYLTDGIFHSNVSGQSARIRLYHTPTVTLAGTPATIVNPHIGGGGSPTATAFTSPTVTSSGTLLRTFNTGQGSQGASIQIDFRMATIVRPGSDLLIAGVPTANNVSVGLNFFWLEAL